MKRTVLWTGMLMIVSLMLLFGAVAKAQAIDVDAKQTELKKECLAATITAINLEIERYQRWIDYRIQQGDRQAVVGWQEALAALKADLDRYTIMDAADYVLPDKLDITGWCGDKPGINSVLYFDSMTKNGPWYHLAGITGGDYTALAGKPKQRMSVYPIYPRSYWGMNSAYVYVAVNTGGSGMTKVAAFYAESVKEELGKRIQGEVYTYTYSGGPLYDIKKCDNYQVYLLKENTPGINGELVIDSRQSTFDITLSDEQLKNYAYLEFVSAYNSKTIKISEIKDEPLKITLEPEVFLKKPAIYLYPTEKSKVIITHAFKGQILTTYPAYTDNWTVIADPDGNLLSLQDNRTYKYLFWDGVYNFPQEHYQYKTGFYVDKQDYAAFLQTKLTAIGLNENEINDFVVYWLPTMNNYQRCFVHFRINDDIDGSSVLRAEPTPQTTIRVFMEFSGVDNINAAPKVPEQILPAFTRKGFTMVEWGGAEIGSKKLQ